MFHKLYLYQRPIELLYLDGGFCCCTLDNQPMNRRKAKIHKGVDNKVQFKVFNQDRQCANIQNLHVSATLVSADRENTEKIFEKPCKMGKDRGTFTLEVQEGDLVNVAPGTYHMIITGADQFTATEAGEIIATPFFSDLNENIVMDIEVVESADTTPVPSVEIQWGDWSRMGMDDLEQERSQSKPFNRYQVGFTKFYTSAIPGNRIKNRLNGTHTFSVQGTNLSGTLRILATLDEIPQPDPNDYFMIDITSIHNEINFDEFTGTESWSFTGNFMWLKFEFLPDYSKGDEWGEITKLIVRS